MLTSRQLRTLLEVVGETNGAADLAELRALVLPAVRRLIPADYCSYNEIAADGSPALAIVDPPVPDEYHAAWARLGGQNPLLQRYLRTQDGRPYRFSDVVSREELHALPIYQELYAPLGIEYQMAMILPAAGGVKIGLVLSRSRPDYSDAERELLGLMRPHLVQAHRNAQLRGPAGAAIAGPAAGMLTGLGLTAAEARVLAALAEGHGTDAVAAALGLSPRTVHKHGERIHRKLGVGDRAQAVAAAWRYASTRTSGG